jgi:hypothetical protein
MAALKNEPETQTPLSKKMRFLAEGGKHPQALDLFSRANDLDAAVFGKPPADIKHVVACWARARRLWTDLTGEELV